VVGGSAHFQFGTSTDYGQTTGEDSVPAGSTGAAAARMSAFRAKAATAEGHLTANLSGLQPSTTYHYRIVASNPDATRVGEDRTFTTGTSGVPQPQPQPGPGPDVKPHRPNVRASQFSGRCFRSRFVFRGRVHVASTTKLRRLRITLDGRTIHRSTRARFTVKVRAGKLKAGYHVLLVRATDRAGNTTTVRRAFMRCRQRTAPAFTG
jgi:hypothetical protein